MIRYLFLDSGPLGVITHPQRSVAVVAATEWLSSCLLFGCRVIVPAIVYYEIKRELLRARKTNGLARLDAFVNASPGRYLVLTDDALRLAADLWAAARQQGRLTADTTALDVDVILAAQVLSLGLPRDEVIIATANAKHLSQFVTAKHWTEIAP